jgi:hypothetical protein
VPCKLSCGCTGNSSDILNLQHFTKQKFITVSELNKPEKINQQILKLPLPAADETLQTIRTCLSDQTGSWIVLLAHV